MPASPPSSPPMQPQVFHRMQPQVLAAMRSLPQTSENVLISAEVARCKQVEPVSPASFASTFEPVSLMPTSPMQLSPKSSVVGMSQNSRSLYSSRSKRKIIGAVVRPDNLRDEVTSRISHRMSVQAEEQLDAGSAILSPKQHMDAGSAIFSPKREAPTPKGPRRSSRGAAHKKPTTTAYRLDLDD